MQVIRIDRLDDPRLADYRNVSDGELLRRRNCFVAEGRLVVGRLLESGHASNRFSQRRIVPGTRRRPCRECRRMCRFTCATQQEFAAITGFNLHRGCLALAQRPMERRARRCDRRRRSDLLVLEAVSDADNIGSAFRNAAAFGASVVLSDDVLRSAVSQGDSHVDGKRAAHVRTRVLATGRTICGH